MITISAFKMVPPFAQGLVRDLRVRWALEEAGLPYTARLLSREDQKSESYLRQQPFGQVPVFEEGDLQMFESGAIVMHVAERSPALMPKDAHGKARTQSWMFAALNTLEPHVQNLATIDLFCADEEWAKLRRAGAVTAVENRLLKLADWLGEKPYLEDRFTAGDLLMTTVLRILRHTDLVAQVPTLAAYQRRCEERPAFQRALAAQMAAFSS